MSERFFLILINERYIETTWVSDFLQIDFCYLDTKYNSILKVFVLNLVDLVKLIEYTLRSSGMKRRNPHSTHRKYELQEHMMARCTLKDCSPTEICASHRRFASRSSLSTLRAWSLTMGDRDFADDFCVGLLLSNSSPWKLPSISTSISSNGASSNWPSFMPCKWLPFCRFMS